MIITIIMNSLIIFLPYLCSVKEKIPGEHARELTRKRYHIGALGMLILYLNMAFRVHEKV